MNKRSKKQERMKSRKRQKKAKRKQKEKQKHRKRKDNKHQELTQAIFAGRAVLRDEDAQDLRLRSLDRTNTIESIQPSKVEQCICGSQLTFGACCSKMLDEGSNAGSICDRLLTSGRNEEALVWCRVHLCWYVLCHRAHTIPRLAAGGAIAKELLAVDIEALDGILHRLKWCLRKTGQGESFRHVLDAMVGVISDRRWADKLALHAASWWQFDMNDSKRATERIASVDTSECRDADVLAKYINLKGSQLPFDERVMLMGRVCELTDDQSIKLQFRGLIGISYLLVCEKEKAVELIGGAADQYRSLSDDQRSWFGDHLFAMSLFLLGSLKNSDELVTEAEKCYSRFLEPARSKDLSQFAVSDYRMQLGRCKAFLDDHTSAIEQYDKSLSVCELALTKIYKAESLVSIGDLDGGRRLLEQIDTESLSIENRHDYAMARTMLAVATQRETDIESAKISLKAFQATEPLWIQQRDQWLITLLETVPNAEAGVIAKMLRTINRYLILQPNFFGLGLNANNVLDDLAGRGR